LSPLGWASEGPLAESPPASDCETLVDCAVASDDGVCDPASSTEAEDPTQPATSSSEIEA
jgi:hypothetical protein